MHAVVSTKYQPPFGLPTLTLSAHDSALVALDWFLLKTQKLLHNIHELPPAQLNASTPSHAVLMQTIAELDEYFAGTRKRFSVPLDLSMATAFQRQVWHALMEIPYGQTISYAKLAANIAKPTAFRACANANGKNPISLIIPCHRVIASDGTLGGYTGGIDIKRTLLAHEKGGLHPQSKMI